MTFITRHFSLICGFFLVILQLTGEFYAGSLENQNHIRFLMTPRNNVKKPCALLNWLFDFKLLVYTLE